VTAELHHRPGVVLGEGEAVAHRAGPVHEQRHRRRGGQLLDRRRGGERQRRDRVLPLGPQPQHRAARGQQRDAGAAGQQLAQVTGGVDHLLQVVQDQQPPVLTQLLGQGLQRRVGPRQVGRPPPGRCRPGPARAGWPPPVGRTRLPQRSGRPRVRPPPAPAASCRPHPARSGSPGPPRDAPAGPRPPRWPPPAHQRGGAHRQRAWAAPTWGRRRWRRPVCGPGTGGGEPLAQQRRQVLAHQPAQLPGLRKYR
jgi:hypothetical protein